MKTIFSLAAALLLFFSQMTPPVHAYAGEPVVRVALMQEIDQARVTIMGPCQILDGNTGAVLARKENLPWALVKPSNPGLKIGLLALEATSVIVRPQGRDLVHLNAKPYRGDFILKRTSRGKLTIINRVNLEQYLVSALGSEAHANWPLETLKAHAVVSRTMLAHRMWISKDKPFDATADVSTHLYYGISSERDRIREAVGETAGQVLAFNRELLSATFHANCGGHTEDARELWEVKGDLTPLRGTEDPHCQGLKHYEWKNRMSVSELAGRLGKEGKGLGRLTGIEVIERNASGRVRQVKFKGEAGEVTLTGRRARELLGANRLRSLKFYVEFSGKEVTLEGFGWGHGVGLCQWGAYGMGEEGHTMDEILNFYFPGCQRRSLKGLPGFVSSNKI